jgi:hypothetical protein
LRDKVSKYGCTASDYHEVENKAQELPRWIFASVTKTIFLVRIFDRFSADCQEKRLGDEIPVGAI